jgi:Yos1-like
MPGVPPRQQSLGGASSAAIAHSCAICVLEKERFLSSATITVRIAANAYFHVKNTPIQAHIITVVASHPIALR